MALPFFGGRREPAPAHIEPPQETLRPKYRFTRLTNASASIVNSSTWRNAAEYIHRQVPAKIFEELNIDQIPSTKFTPKGMTPTPVSEYKVSFDESMNMVSLILVNYRTLKLGDIGIRDYGVLEKILTVLLGIMAFDEQNMIAFIGQNRDIYNILGTTLPPITELFPNSNTDQ